MNKKFIDLTGKKFNNLEVIKLVSTHDKRVHHSVWECKCICGKIFTKIHSNIIKGKNLGCNNCYRIYGQIKLRPFESKYNVLKTLNKNRVSVDLTYEEFLEFTKILECHYCGSTLKRNPYKCSGYYLDRKDNNLGYSVTNCVTCCPRCNAAKSDHFTYEEWKQIGELIKTWRT